jgi:hypothetical protein
VCEELLSCPFPCGWEKPPELPRFSGRPAFEAAAEVRGVAGDLAAALAEIPDRRSKVSAAAREGAT